MESCEFLEKCPIFAKFKTEGLKNFWISMYCKGLKQVDCVRHQLKKEGKEVPISLLPNGAYLDILNEE